MFVLVPHNTFFFFFLFFLQGLLFILYNFYYDGKIKDQTSLLITVTQNVLIFGNLLCLFSQISF